MPRGHNVRTFIRRIENRILYLEVLAELMIAGGNV